jgi:hypothetical protein
MPFQRGAPKGNRNRLKHGRYTRAATERRTLQRAQIRALKNLAIKATFVFHARRALRLKNESAHHIPPQSEAWRGVRTGVMGDGLIRDDR